MKRRLLSLLVGLGMLSGLFTLGVATATPAAAACGSNSGTYGTHYSNGVWDGATYVYVKITVYQSWSYGNCFDYVISTYASNGTSMYASPLSIRVWKCGAFYANWKPYFPIFDTGWIAYQNCGPQADDAGSVIRSQYGNWVTAPYVSW